MAKKAIKKEEKQGIENIVVTGAITATSNKLSSEYPTEQPHKTAYFTVIEEDRKACEDFGLTEYTSEKDGKNFFCAKLSTAVTCYIKSTGQQIKTSGLVESVSEDGALVSTPNFKTAEDIMINLIKSENKGNIFYRIQALLLDNVEDIEIIVPQNPFESFMTAE